MKGELCLLLTFYVFFFYHCVPSNTMGFCKFQRLVDSMESKASNLSTTNQSDLQQVTITDQNSVTSVAMQPVHYSHTVTAASSMNSYESTMKASANADYTSKAKKDVHVTTEGFPTTILGCPDNMVVGDCTSSCQATCQDPFGCHGNCAQQPSCVCPNGLFLREGTCVTQNVCDCFVAEEGVLVPEGGTFISPGCDKICSCNESKIQCDVRYECDAQATCDEREAGRRCYCNEGYAGDGQFCTRLVDCYQLLQAGESRSGVYTIFPVNWPKTTLSVSCDMATDGGGWTVFQKRFDKSVNFSRDWVDYKNGFGDLSGELWLGNEAIHVITEATNYTLRVELTTDSGDVGFAVYENFRVASEASFYALGVSGYDTSSTAGDSLSHHNQMNFSTFDKENDASPYFHCADKYSGGWWYSGCFFADLNSNTKAIWQLNYFNAGINESELKLKPTGV